MPRAARRSVLPALVVALVLAAALPAVGVGVAGGPHADAAGVAGGPHAHAARACHVPSDGHGWGPTYVTSMSVSHTSCRTGRKVVKAYYRCRVAHGGRKGSCHRRVDRFRCHERRLAAIKTQFDAKVTCARGHARVRHTYTQFT